MWEASRHGSAKFVVAARDPRSLCGNYSAVLWSEPASRPAKEVNGSGSQSPGRWSLAVSCRDAFDGVEHRIAYWAQGWATMVAVSALSLSAGLLSMVWAGEATLDR